MNPETMLKTVVLPAPFGPISEVSDPSVTSKLTASTARTPPKDLPSPLTSRSATSFLQEQLAPVAEHTLRPESHEEDEEQADEKEAKEGARAGIEEGEREEVEEARAGIEEAEEDRAERDRPHPVH